MYSQSWSSRPLLRVMCSHEGADGNDGAEMSGVILLSDAVLRFFAS